MRPKRLLMVCYFYPPINDGGVERSAKFAGYLPAYGWTPVVVTTSAHGASGDADAERRITRVPELLALYRWLFNKGAREARRTKRGIPVLPATTPERGIGKAVVGSVLRWVMIPDAQMGWIPCALFPALSLLRGADAILTSSPPESSHLLGLLLKNLTGRPWVMDLRDPWTFEPWKDHLRESSFRRSVEKRLESACVARADAVVLNTPEAKESYETLYPEHAARMHTIPNGFDARELSRAAATLDEPSPWGDLGEAFVISHVGAFSRRAGGDQPPPALLEALKGLCGEGVLSTGRSRVVFAGRLDPGTAGRISAFGLEGVVVAPGVMTHLDAARLMLRSDLLLLYDPAGDGRTYVRGKLYEYLGSGKRIMGIVPDGATRELLKRSGRGLLAYPNDVEGIKRAIRGALEGRGFPKPDPGFDLASYERVALTGQLAALLSALVTMGRPMLPRGASARGPRGAGVQL